MLSSELCCVRFALYYEPPQVKSIRVGTMRTARTRHTTHALSDDHTPREVYTVQSRIFQSSCPCRKTPQPFSGVICAVCSVLSAGVHPKIRVTESKHAHYHNTTRNARAQSQEDTPSNAGTSYSAVEQPRWFQLSMSRGV